MQKSMRLSDYHYPYVIFISKFLHYFEIDLEEELSKMVKPSHEVNNGSLNTMELKKIGGKWIRTDGDQVGSLSEIHVEDDGEEQAATAAGVDGDDGQQARERKQGNEGPSAGNMDERITSMSPFERLMISRMDNFTYD